MKMAAGRTAQAYTLAYYQKHKSTVIEIKALGKCNKLQNCKVNVHLKLVEFGSYLVAIRDMCDM